MPPIHSFLFCTLLTVIHLVNASVTVYYQPGQAPLSTGTGTAAGALYTGAAAYDPTVLTPPAVPANQSTQFTIQLQNGGTPNVSIPQSGAFVGFSIEMSVVNQIIGKNSSLIQVPFLNLMSNIIERAGSVIVRVGGNTQETAQLVNSTSDGRILEKNKAGTFNPTNTPPLIYTADLLYMMRNVSALANVRWFLGIPFFNITPPQLAIAEAGQAILGDFLLGLQAGNEPDLYTAHGHRPSTYSPYDYFGELGQMVQAVNNDSNIPVKQTLIAPNLATNWSPESVWNTGLVASYSNNLAYLAFERYPADNCGAQFGLGTAIDPQTIFANYLTHNAGQQLVSNYLNSTAYAQSVNKKLLMFETNTASCGGFPGISDSFGAALWGLDYSLQMAYSNFSGAMFHIGGQNVYYNPFTSPPTNQSTYHRWTIGPIYYSALVSAETLGPTNTSQVLDLNANNGNQFTPAYAIYENGNPVRVALFNYVTDPSGASNLTVSIAIGGGNTGQPNATPSEVKVKYLAASSVAQKGNFTWAGQTFGDTFASDGRLMGTESVQTITCNPSTNTCQIPVPAPGFALVFLKDTTQIESGGGPTTTYSTSSVTKLHNTISVNPAVLATSNGHSGMDQMLGSTSYGSVSGAGARWGVCVGVGAVVGGLGLGMGLAGALWVW